MHACMHTCTYPTHYLCASIHVHKYAHTCILICSIIQEFTEADLHTIMHEVTHGIICAHNRQQEALREGTTWPLVNLQAALRLTSESMADYNSQQL